MTDLCVKKVSGSKKKKQSLKKGHNIEVSKSKNKSAMNDYKNIPQKLKELNPTQTK